MVKKQKQINGVYYQKLNKSTYKYLRFEGDTISVWKTSTKPQKKQRYSYSDFVKSTNRQNKTAYQITDSLLTFTFSKRLKNGNYIFDDYHCILENEEKLIIKRGSTNKIVEIEVYKLYNPEKSGKRFWFWQRKSKGVVLVD